MTPDDIVRLDAVTQRRLIGQRALSPVELMQACIARMEALNPGVNALAATDFERAMDAARAAEAQVMRGDALPLLHGLPLGVTLMGRAWSEAQLLGYGFALEQKLMARHAPTFAARAAD